MRPRRAYSIALIRVFMEFSHRHLLQLGLVLATASATVASCSDQQASLIIVGAVPLTADDTTGACTPGTGADSVLSQGVLDVSFGTSYLLALTLANQLNPGSGGGGVDMSEMQIKDADISLSIPQAPEIIDAVVARDESLVSFGLPLATVSLPAGNETTVIMEVVPGVTTQALAEEMSVELDPGQQVTLLVEVVVQAERSGGSTGNIGVIDSRAFRFPITLCDGCLVDCSACPMGQCPTETTSYVGGVCGNAQDFPLVPAGCVAE